jgi:hypothetical protein
MDAESLAMLEDTLRKTMQSTCGAELDTALAELGWAEMLTDMSELAIPLVFRLLGETGSHASVVNDVVLLTAGRLAGCRCTASRKAGTCDCPMLAARWPGGWSVRQGRC